MVPDAALDVAPVVRLPLSFDVAALADEAVALPADAWTPHFNTAIYEGDWSGVPLRVATSSPLALYPDPNATDYTSSEHLGRCPDIAAALARFGCPLQTVRLLRLGPGARILAHRDHALAAEHGEVRLHIPLVSPPGVRFTLDDVPVEMAPGECWYLDLTRMHTAHNPATTNRIHLVIDCEVDGWLTEQFRLGAHLRELAADT
jgi:hypothetical protein